MVRISVDHTGKEGKILCRHVSSEPWAEVCGGERKAVRVRERESTALAARARFLGRPLGRSLGAVCGVAFAVALRRRSLSRLFQIPTSCQLQLLWDCSARAPARDCLRSCREARGCVASFVCCSSLVCCCRAGGPGCGSSVGEGQQQRWPRRPAQAGSEQLLPQPEQYYGQ